MNSINRLPIRNSYSCFDFARMTGKERVINTDTVFCIVLMTLSGIPVGNDIQCGRLLTDILPGIPFLIIKSIFIHIKISYKCHEGV